MPLGEGGEDFHDEQIIQKKSIVGNSETKRYGGGGTIRPNEEKQRTNFVVPGKGLVTNTAGSIL
jgi:hypothetical protein